MPDRDLTTLSRREALRLFGAAGAALSAGACSGGTLTSPTATTTATTTTATTNGTTTTPPSTTTCAVTPSETAGPFPSIALPTRSDVREDRTGLLLSLAIAVVNTNAACAPVMGASVEIWHCDARGDYSEYGAQASATWLRGLQPVDAAGKATFTTVYPGWYQGRATRARRQPARRTPPIWCSPTASPRSRRHEREHLDRIRGHLHSGHRGLAGC
ncbi:MAG: hypothetical protein ABI665_28010 [Vicinamibacterales bacterium]